MDLMLQRWQRLYSEVGAVCDGSEKLLFTYVEALNPDSPDRAFHASIGFKHDGTALRGTRFTTYNRMRLWEMFVNIQPVVYVYNAHYLHEIVAALLDKYPICANASMFADGAVNGNRLEYNVQLDFKDTIYTMNGQINDITYKPLTVRVLQPTEDISVLFKDTIMSAPSLPYTIRSGYTNTEMISFSVDFTPDNDQDFLLLKAIAKNDDLYAATDPEEWRAAVVIGLIHTRLGLDATVDGGIDGTFTTAGAKFVYNGSTQGFANANTQYDNVLVFDTQLDPAATDATTYRGRVYMHYNNVI